MALESLETQLEIVRIQTPDVIRVFDPVTKTFSRHFGKVEIVIHDIIYDTDTGEIKGTGTYKIINIPLNPDNAREEMKPVTTKIRDLMLQLHPLVIEATLLECACLEEMNNEPVEP